MPRNMRFRRLPAPFVDVYSDDRRAFRRKQFRDRLANSAGHRRNQCHPTFKAHSGPCLYRWNELSCKVSSRTALWFSETHFALLHQTSQTNPGRLNSWFPTPGRDSDPTGRLAEVGYAAMLHFNLQRLGKRSNPEVSK